MVTKAKKVSVLKEYSYRGVVTNSINAFEGEYPTDLIRNFIVHLILSGTIEDPFENKDMAPFYFRYLTLCKAYPSYGFPEINKDDVELLLHEWVGDRKSVKELSISNFNSIFKDYIGPEACGWIKKQLPLSIQLPSKRTGKLVYFANSPPELTARITDFSGMEGPYFLCDGKIEVVYNLLAPNYRSAQKTKNLTDFWKNSYPEIKKELRGRYPKHPWP